MKPALQPNSNFSQYLKCLVRADTASLPMCGTTWGGAAVYQPSAPVDPDVVELVAEQALLQTRDFDSAQIGERTIITFAGLDGMLLGGTHTDPAGGFTFFRDH